MADLTNPHLDGELLSAYLDGELHAGELDVVVAHLSTCEPCIAEFHSLKETRAWLRTLPELAVPDRVVSSVHYGPELSAYLDGELLGRERDEVIRHLAVCEHCREELHELDAARVAVRSLPRLDPPVVLGAERETRRPVRRWGIAASIAGVAAAALVAVAVGVGTADSGTTSQVDLDSFADRHVARASVEPGFSVIPAVGPAGGTP